MIFEYVLSLSKIVALTFTQYVEKVSHVELPPFLGQIFEDIFPINNILTYAIFLHDNDARSLINVDTILQFVDCHKQLDKHS